MGIVNSPSNCREAIGLTSIQRALANRLCELVDGLPSDRKRAFASHLKGLVLNEEKSGKEGCEETCKDNSAGGNTCFGAAPQGVD